MKHSSTSISKSVINDASQASSTPGKVFNIDKDKRDDEISSFDENSFNSEEEPLDSRVSAYSKVNFSKLSDREKDKRLKNLSTLITRLRKKIRNQETKYNNLTDKKFKKYFKEKTEGADLDLDNLISAIKILKNYNKHEFEDQKNIIQNLIDSIAKGRLTPDSIHFKKICTQARMRMDPKNVKYIEPNSNSINYSFLDKDVTIGPTEYEYYKDYQKNENVMRSIFGIEAKKEYPEQIRFGDAICGPMMNYQVMNYLNTLINNFK